MTIGGDHMRLDHVPRAAGQDVVAGKRQEDQTKRRCVTRIAG
jgi:hypothetical protein